MVAVDIQLRDNGRVRHGPSSPIELAHELAETADAAWIRELVDALDREIRRRPLERVISLWDLSNASAARLFGVSRQAFSKWLTKGPPADRVDDVSRVEAITDLLDRYVKRERIPAVVRRPATALDDRSIIEILQQGDYQRAAEAVAAMFDLRRLQP
jgi:predicted transcriptional regulator